MDIVQDHIIYQRGQRPDAAKYYSPDKGGRVKDPPSTDPHIASKTSNSIDNHRAKGTGRVNATTRERNEDQVGDKDGPSDGNGSGISSSRLAVNSGMKDGKNEQIGAHRLNKECGSGTDARPNHIDTQTKGRSC